MALFFVVQRSYTFLKYKVLNNLSLQNRYLNLRTSTNVPIIHHLSIYYLHYNYTILSNQ